MGNDWLTELIFCFSYFKTATCTDPLGPRSTLQFSADLGGYLLSFVKTVWCHFLAVKSHDLLAKKMTYSFMQPKSKSKKEPVCTYRSWHLTATLRKSFSVRCYNLIRLQKSCQLLKWPQGADSESQQIYIVSCVKMSTKMNTFTPWYNKKPKTKVWTNYFTSMVMFGSLCFILFC